MVMSSFDKARGHRDQNTNLIEGTIGLIIDARGRPLNIMSDTAGRVEKLRSYLKAFNLPLPK